MSKNQRAVVLFWAIVLVITSLFPPSRDRDAKDDRIIHQFLFIESFHDGPFHLPRIQIAGLIAYWGVTTGVSVAAFSLLSEKKPRV